MEKKHIILLSGKKVQIKTVDNFFITTTLPKIIDDDIISVIDKFGKIQVLDISTIVSIREVSQ